MNLFVGEEWTYTVMNQRGENMIKMSTAHFVEFSYT